MSLKAGWGLLLIMLSQFSTPALVVAQESASGLEELNYQVDVWVWRDAARGQLSLKNLGAGHYLAELLGETRGLAGLLSGQRRDTYQTEMVYKEGRLLPLIYREESRRRGKHYLKEYRFDYDRARLELWQLKERPGRMVLKWHTDLKVPVFDPLTAFYNCRLGLPVPIKEGETVQIAGIPYPAPETMEVRLGPNTQAGRQAMVSLINPAFPDRKGQVFILINGAGVPVQVWTRVLGLGKTTGILLPGSKSLKNGLPGIPPPGGDAK